MPVFGTRTLWLLQILIVILVIYLVIAARAFLLVGPAPTTAEEVSPAAGDDAQGHLWRRRCFATTFRSWGMSLPHAG